MDAIPDAEEGFLYEVFGDPGIADDAQDERISDAAVAIVQFGEGLRVAALKARDQIAVGGGSVNREDERQEHHNASIVYTSEIARQMWAK